MSSLVSNIPSSISCSLFENSWNPCGPRIHPINKKPRTGGTSSNLQKGTINTLAMRNIKISCPIDPSSGDIDNTGCWTAATGALSARMVWEKVLNAWWIVSMDPEITPAASAGIICIAWSMSIGINDKSEFHLRILLLVFGCILFLLKLLLWLWPQKFLWLMSNEDLNWQDDLVFPRNDDDLVTSQDDDVDKDWTLTRSDDRIIAENNNALKIAILRIHSGRILPIRLLREWYTSIL